MNAPGNISPSAPETVGHCFPDACATSVNEKDRKCQFKLPMAFCKLLPSPQRRGQIYINRQFQSIGRHARKNPTWHPMNWNSPLLLLSQSEPGKGHGGGCDQEDQDAGLGDGSRAAAGTPGARGRNREF
jgi:hypothetical protein